jgi:hypothetical protein
MRRVRPPGRRCNGTFEFLEVLGQLPGEHSELLA